MQTPFKRFRRLRRNSVIRDMVQETRLTSDGLIQPFFIRPGEGIRNPISSMPGQFQYSIDTLIKEVAKMYDAGLKSVILFGIPEHKDAVGSDAMSEDGIICRAIRRLKEQLPELYVISDVCFCEYTDHGHCGVLTADGVQNDATLENLQKQVLVQARSGVDMVAPSGMMDGMVRAIRAALDKGGFPELPIMSYAAKYSSSFYGPFRDAAESAPQHGDRKAYQMNPANSNEALREVEQDILEGADIVMVKPALAYLDILRRIKDEFRMPTAAYQVSGEYAMIKAAAANGWLNEQAVAYETLLSIKRAGADIIISYYAADFAAQL
ncbi:MAG: porphobilinogen synthase [Calditrichota bacterium]